MRLMAATQCLILAAMAVGVVAIVWRAATAYPFAYQVAGAVVYRGFLLGLFPLLVLALLYGVAGRGLGIAGLFWVDEPRKRFSAAAVVTFCLAVIATLMYLAYRMDVSTEFIAEPYPFAEYHAFLGLFYGPVVALVLAPAVIPSAFRYVPRAALSPRRGGLKAEPRAGLPPDVTRNPAAWAHALAVWSAGVAFGLVIVLLSLTVIERFHQGVLFSIMPHDSGRRSHVLTLQALFMFVVMTGVFAACYAVFSFVRPIYEHWISPAGAICVLLILASFAYVCLDGALEATVAWAYGWHWQYVHAMPHVRILVYSLLLGWFYLWNRGPFKLRFPGMEMYYERPIPLSKVVKKAYIRENRVVEWCPQPDDDCELRLLPPGCGEEMPATGEKLIVVAAVPEGLHIRLFDGDGNVVDIAPGDRADGIGRLERRLRGLWPPRPLTRLEKRRIVDAVRAIAGQDLGCGAEARLTLDIDALEAWFRNVTGREPDDVRSIPPADRPRLALVAVSGGGSRAAMWSAVVLDRLDRMIPRFREHVRVITGASGGMLGASYFLKSCRNDPPGPPSVERPAPWVADLPTSSIRPVARFLAMRGPWLTWFSRGGGIFGHDDHGVHLEADWGPIDFPLQDLRDLEERGKIPSIILSPMMVEDGRRLLISNLDLRDMTVVQGGALTFDHPGDLDYPYSLTALEFFRLFPKARGFRLATGVRMSATFPYLSPAVNLPTDPPRRVVDAGYYDNYGVQVATAWVVKNRSWLHGHTSGVVLIQIRDAISQKERLEVADVPRGPLAALARAFRFFTSPVDGAASARHASTLFRNDQDIWELSDLFNRERPLEPDPNQADPARLDRDFFTTVVFENSADVTFRGRGRGKWPGEEPLDNATADVPLNWHLSGADKDGLIDAIPEPGPDTPWIREDHRHGRIRELYGKVNATKGRERDEWLKLLEQAKNYERLVVLRKWWCRPPAPAPAGIVEALAATRPGREPDPAPVARDVGPAAPSPHFSAEGARKGLVAADE